MTSSGPDFLAGGGEMDAGFMSGATSGVRTAS